MVGRHDLRRAVCTRKVNQRDKKGIAMLTMRLRFALFIAAVTSIGSGGYAIAVDAAADAAASATIPGKESPELQEIVVTGMRASLEKSLEIKKDAARNNSLPRPVIDRIPAAVQYVII